MKNKKFFAITYTDKLISCPTAIGFVESKEAGWEVLEKIQEQHKGKTKLTKFGHIFDYQAVLNTPSAYFDLTQINVLVVEGVPEIPFPQTSSDWSSFVNKHLVK